MNRQERRVAQRQARGNIPPEVKSMIAGMAENAKGQPWIVAYWAVGDLIGLVLHLANREKGYLTERQLNAMAAEMTTVLLEGMSPLPKGCDDPFQSSAYHTSSRGDLNRLAQQYVDGIGGPEVASTRMTEWKKENRTLIETLPRGLPTYGGVRPSEGPPGNLDDLLDKWTLNAREQLEVRGSVEPFAVGVLPDGSEMFLTMHRGFERQTEQAQFRTLTGKQFGAAGAVQTVEIFEAWVARSESRVQPSKVDDREEAIVINVLDGDQQLSAVCVIERDWQSGAPTLKDTEKSEPILLRRMTGDAPVGTA